jgi:hypothetical protein
MYALVAAPLSRLNVSRQYMRYPFDDGLSVAENFPAAFQTLKTCRGTSCPGVSWALRPRGLAVAAAATPPTPSRTAAKQAAVKIFVLVITLSSEMDLWTEYASDERRRPRVGPPPLVSSTTTLALSSRR